MSNDRPFDCDACADFWRSIILTPLGDIDKEAVAAELHDYRTLLDEVPKVYDHITGGRISKPNTLAHHVIAEAEEHYAEPQYGDPT